MPRRAAAPVPTPAPVRHEVRIASLHGHRYSVRLRIARPAATQRVSLPAWIPGSYLIREFARHLLPITASQGRAARACRQIDKSSWDIDCDPRRPLELRYEVYAFDTSVRTAWLDGERGFFNGTSLLLRVHGQEQAAHELTRARPAPAARLAAGHRHDAGAGRRAAASAATAPTTTTSWSTTRSSWARSGAATSRPAACRTASWWRARRPPSTASACCATRTTCEAAIRLWHGAKAPPHRHYLFMLNAVGDGYGG